MRSRAAGNTKVLNSLAGVALSAEEQSVSTSGSVDGKLVKSEGLPTSLDDAGAGSLSEAEGSDRHLGKNGHALIVSDGSDDNSNERLLAGTFVHILGDSRERHDGSVSAGHAETLQDDLVEGRVSATRKEAIELDKKLDVSVLANRSLTDALLDVVLGNVNTLQN